MIKRLKVEPDMLLSEWLLFITELIEKHGPSARMWMNSNDIWGEYGSDINLDYNPKKKLYPQDKG